MFEVLPEFMQAEYVSVEGWPGEQGEDFPPFAGVAREAALGLPELEDSGKTNEVAAIWRAFKGNASWKRLRASVAE